MNIKNIIRCLTALLVPVMTASHLHAQDIVTEDISYTYDSSERLVEVTHSLNGGTPVLLSRNSYDELGRLSMSERGASPSLSTTRSYNVRSWLTGISGPLFCETLHYDDLRHSSQPSSMRRYGGDISSMEWRASGDSGTRSYDFAYDGLGRLVSAEYGENGRNVSGYGTSYSYDIMGNVLSLSREGDITPFRKGTVDNLSMAYDGGRLLSVSDAADDPAVTGSMDFRDWASADVEYTYDRNGAMTSDLNRGITGISYNRTGRPARIAYTGGVETFSYLPDGTKLERSVSRDGETSSVTEYRGNLVYEDGSLKYVLVDGGMVSMEGDTPRYLLFLDDHLGSTRVVAAQNGTVAQVNHYYPFGMSFAGGTMADDLAFRPEIGGGEGRPVIGGGHEIGGGIGGSIDIDSFSTEQPYRFIGNELYSGSGLGLYDFKARLYDPAIGRFLSVDPMAEKYAPFGTYGYCIGNPVRFLDDGGEDIVLFGKNDSSVTIRTDLIDFSVNVGTLGIDWRGNHILAGQETLSAALDLAGWVDPTGMADGANAILQASQKDYWGALQSSIALLPLGDVVKVGRIGKDINILSNAVGIATHKHPLIPKAVYRNNEGVFKGLLKRDSAENLIELPAGFHGNHPEYNKWIQNKITEKTTKGHALSKDDLNKIMSEAQKEINKAYDLFNSGSDKNLNKYFKSLNNLPN